MHKSFSPILEIGLLSENQLAINVVHSDIDTHKIIEKFFTKYYSRKGVRVLLNRKELIAQ